MSDTDPLLEMAARRIYGVGWDKAYSEAGREHLVGPLSDLIREAEERGHRNRRAFTCNPEPGDERRYLTAIHDSYGATAEETDENLLAIIKTIIRNTEHRSAYVPCPTCESVPDRSEFCDTCDKSGRISREHAGWLEAAEWLENSTGGWTAPPTTKDICAAVLRAEAACRYGREKP